MSRPLTIAMRGLGPSLRIVARGLGKVLLALLVIAGVIAAAFAIVWLLTQLLVAMYVIYLLVTWP